MKLKHVGENTIIREWVRFIRLENISIGDNCMIDDFVIIAGGRNSHLTLIGNHVHIAPFTSILGSAGVALLDFVTLAPGCRLFSESEDYLESAFTNPTVPDKYRSTSIGQIVLGRFVILGANCVVLPGVTIGEGASVGALSLIKDNIEPWTVNAGIPTRQIKKRDKNRILELYQKMIKEE